MGVAGQGSVETEILFQVFERDEDVDITDGGGVVADRFKNTHFPGCPFCGGPGQEGGLEIGIDPGFLFRRFQRIDPERIIFLFGGREFGGCGGGKR